MGIWKKEPEKPVDMLDANKTALTHRVTALACAYLDAGGFKPVETEVSVENGWIADVASFGYPTRTEAKNLKLIPRLKCDEFEERYHLLCYQFGSPITSIVEVKTSVSDFKKDFERKFRGYEFPAHLCYLAYPNGMIDKSDIPRGWIGLETDRDGNRMYRVHITSSYDCIHPQKPGNVTDLIARVAIRRDHRTRYAAMKAFVKARRSREKEYKKEYTVTSAISNIVDYLKGSVMFENCTSIVEVLNRRGIHIPDYLSDKVSWLEQFKQGKRT